MRGGPVRPSVFGVSFFADRFVLPRWLRRPARLFARLCSGDYSPPRFSVAIASAVLLSSSGLYGAYLGGEIPADGPGGNGAPRLRRRSGARVRQCRDLRDRHSRAARSRRLDVADRLRCRAGAPAHRRAALGRGCLRPQGLSRYGRSQDRRAQAVRHLAAWQPIGHRRAGGRRDRAFLGRPPFGAAAGHRLWRGEGRRRLRRQDRAVSGACFAGEGLSSGWRAALGSAARKRHHHQAAGRRRRPGDRRGAEAGSRGGVAVARHRLGRPAARRPAGHRTDPGSGGAPRQPRWPSRPRPPRRSRGKTYELDWRSKGQFVPPHPASSRCSTSARARFAA